MCNHCNQLNDNLSSNGLTLDDVNASSVKVTESRINVTLTLDSAVGFSGGNLMYHVYQSAPIGGFCHIFLGMLRGHFGIDLPEELRRLHSVTRKDYWVRDAFRKRCKAHYDRTGEFIQMGRGSKELFKTFVENDCTLLHSEMSRVFNNCV